MPHISIIALPGCLFSAITGIIDILTLANACYGDTVFTTDIISTDGKPVTSYSGHEIQPDHAMADTKADIVIIPPVFEHLESSLSMKDLVGWIKTQHEQKTIMTSICAGSFFLAEAGILSGREATTHWNLAQDFKEKFSDVVLNADRLMVNGGDYICVGGATAGMDLALYLISRYTNREISRRCARIMLIDVNREHQNPYAMAGFRKTHGDSPILAVQEWMEKNFTGPLTIKDMAGMARMGERTFIRRFKSATGETPGIYLQQLRLESSKNLLEQTDLSIEQISTDVGYNDYSSFRKMFIQKTGCSPANYRQRFGVRD